MAWFQAGSNSPQLKQWGESIGHSPTVECSRAYPVVCDNSAQGTRPRSSRTSAAAEPLTALQQTCPGPLCLESDELVAEALVRPFLMVMVDELSNSSAEVRLAERDD